MLFIRCFTRYILFFSLIFSQVAIATVFEKKCAGKYFIIEMYNGFDISEIKYKLYYKEKNEGKKLFFKTRKGVILNAACIQNKRKQDLMLFLESSGGNAGPEDRYGIFDPNAKKMLMSPPSKDEGNSKEVEKLIGYTPPFPIYDGKDKTFFCCFNIQNYD